MRPLIVIGASDAMRAALEPYAEVGHIEHHPTAERAYFALLDLLRESHQTDDHPELSLTENGWNVHVAYGPDSYGALATGSTSGTSARLPHLGRTLVLAWNLDPDPGRPRRVVDGAAPELPDPNMPWQVAAAISADYVVDMSGTQALPFLVRLLEWKDGAHT